MSFVSYLRVSTSEQGRSGLGLAAQQAAIAAFVRQHGHHGRRVLGEYVEVRSGGDDQRPELARAVAHAQRTGATLIVAKLCRLSRDAAYTLALTQRLPVVAADAPSDDETMTGIRAVMNQRDRQLIKQRTREALAVAKARGTTLGGWRGGPPVDPALGRQARTETADGYARQVGPEVAELRAAGHSLRAIAAEMGGRSVRTPNGGAWTADTVRTILRRLAALS